jgi:hydroxyacylglutathione hydrolase
MLLRCFHTEGLSINSYLVGDETTGRAAVIDPTIEIESYIQFASKEKLKITDILETHVHADFISGALKLKQYLGNCPTIHCSALGGEKWIPYYADQAFQQGHLVNLGNIRLEAIHTPGHTPEHVMWLCFDDKRSPESPCLAFSGDCLFVGSVGRPDLLGKEEVEHLAKLLYHTLFVELTKLPDFLEIFPAHGAGSLCGKGLSARPSTTLGYERMFNPYLTKHPEDEWLQDLLADMPSAPPNFQTIKQLNVSKAVFQVSPVTMAVDVRHPLNFAKGHIQGALNIPLGPSFCNWAASVIPPGARLEIFAENVEQLNHAKRNLALIGLDQIVGEKIWSHLGEQERSKIEILPLVSVEEVAQKLKNSPKSFYILDVRTPAEWKEGHIKEAHWLELSKIRLEKDKLPSPSTSIYVICGSGYRSSVVASFLKNSGYENVSSIWGGMTAWKAQDFS